MATIERRGDGWRVRWRDPATQGGASRSRQCPTAAVARRLKLDVEEAHALGRAWQPAAPVGHPPLTDLMGAYLRDLARTKRPNTVARAHAALGPFLAWLGPSPTTGDLGRQKVADYDAQMVAKGRQPRTRRTSLWAIGGCWQWGWAHPDWRPVLAEPSMPSRPEAVQAEVRAATWAQLDAVVIAAEAQHLKSRAWVPRLALLLRGLGWRVSQCLALEARDVDIAAGTIRLRPELGKSRWERRGRTVPAPPWLIEAIASWGVREGRLIGRPVSSSQACHMMPELWAQTDAPPEIYEGRPDHAFRIAIVSGLNAARVDRDATEHYVGHQPMGMRGPYVDPASLPMHEVAAAIPCVRRVSTAEVVDIARARRKRA
jgi:integrase